MVGPHSLLRQADFDPFAAGRGYVAARRRRVGEGGEQLFLIGRQTIARHRRQIDSHQLRSSAGDRSERERIALPHHRPAFEMLQGNAGRAIRLAEWRSEEVRPFVGFVPGSKIVIEGVSGRGVVEAAFVEHTLHRTGSRFQPEPDRSARITPAGLATSIAAQRTRLVGDQVTPDRRQLDERIISALELGAIFKYGVFECLAVIATRRGEGFGNRVAIDGRSAVRAPVIEHQPAHRVLRLRNIGLDGALADIPREHDARKVVHICNRLSGDCAHCHRHRPR